MSLCEWFDIGTYNNHTDRYQFKTLTLNDCILKKSLEHFLIGTQFKEVQLYDSGTMILKIERPDDYVSKLSEKINGHWSLIINNQQYRYLFGKDGFCYVDRKKIKKQNGFSYQKIECHDNTLLYPKGTIIKNATFDLLDGHFTGFINTQKITHDVFIQLTL
ncbi:MAG TPA: hypothetical protein VLG50_08410 [Candidatus Saccharimonadales bacterium]|nr:hypothetical protein [Candidatus Saccharimonadales bacterium]